MEYYIYNIGVCKINARPGVAPSLLQQRQSKTTTGAATLIKHTSNPSIKPEHHKTMAKHSKIGHAQETETPQSTQTNKLWGSTLSSGEGVRGCVSCCG
eukprot:309685-Lingulodinium_polyedra.AAC.1